MGQGPAGIETGSRARRTGVVTRLRRSALTAVALGLVCVLVSAAAPRVSARAAAWLSVTKVRGRTISVQVAAAAHVAKGLPVAPIPVVAAEGRLDPGWTFNMVGALFRGSAEGGRYPVVEVRTALDDGEWTAWRTLSFESGAADGRLMGDPLWIGEARLLEYRAVGPSGDLDFTFINSLGDATAGDRVAGSVRKALSAVAGVTLPDVAGAGAAMPAIVTRQQWGADESLRSGQPVYAPLKMVFVHHTVSGNGYKREESPAVMRAIYYYHTKSCGFQDIGYNFLVDRYGTIYEGRYGGMDRGVVGAQTLGFNTGTCGISLIGDFTSAAPPTAMLAGLEYLLAWKLDVHHIDPLSKVRLVCGATDKYKAGQTVTFDAISGHRDACYTACPGDTVYAKLPEIRSVVASTGLPKIYGFSTTTGLISPDGDGNGDTVEVSFIVSEAAQWNVEVTDAAGVVMRSFTGNGTEVSVTWDGRSDAGKVVPDGTYTVTGTAVGPSGAATPVTGTVDVDLTVPRFTGFLVRATVVNPEGSGAGDRAGFSYALSEPCSVQIVVKSAAGATVRTLQAWTAVPAGPRSFSWDGKVSSGGKLVPAAEGVYTIVATAKDAAGNKAVAEGKVVVDRTVRVSTTQPLFMSPNGDGVQDTGPVEFVLLRQATLTVHVLQAGKAVVSVPLGKQAAGEHQWIWDGRTAAGKRLPGGPYSIELTAVTSKATTKAACATVIDLAGPTLRAGQATTAVRIPKAAGFSYVVKDLRSVKAHVTAEVRNAAKKVVKRIDCGWVMCGQPQQLAYRPPKPGLYTVSLGAVDQAGNREVARVEWRVRAKR